MNRLQYIIVFVLVLTVTACQPTETQSPRSSLPTPQPIPSYLEGMLSFTDQNTLLGNEVLVGAGGTDDLVSDFESRLKDDPTNPRGYILLAQINTTTGEYRKAINNLQMAIALDPDLSDPHYGLANIVYDLALLDMVARQTYEQDEKGFLLLSPDETTRQLFQFALEQYNIGKSRPQSLDYAEADGTHIYYYDPEKIETRIRQSSLYLGSVPEEAVFMEDQSKLARWMINLNTRFPDHNYMDTAQRVLEYFVEEFEEFQRSQAENAYSHYMQGIENSRDTNGKYLLTFIDESSHPNKAYMGLAVFLETFTQLWEMVCSINPANGELAQNSLQLSNNFLNSMSIYLPPDMKATLDLDACAETVSGDDLRTFVYGELVNQRDQATADIYKLSRYVILIDAYVMASGSATLEFKASAANEMDRVLVDLANTLELPSEEEAILDEVRRRTIPAFADGSIMTDETTQRITLQGLYITAQYILQDTSRQQ